MKINLQKYSCTYAFLLRKCDHLPEELQGKIAEDLCLNNVSYVEASSKYNMDLLPETLFDIDFMLLVAINPEFDEKKELLRTEFLNSTKLSFKSKDDEDCFFSLFLALFVTFQRNKELHLLYKSNDELSIDCIIAWAKSLDKTNNPFYNKIEVKNVIEVLTNRIKQSISDK